MSTMLDEPALQTVTEADFRSAMGRFSTGVTVVTSYEEGEDWGATVSAFSSVSNDPPSVLVCLNQTSETGQAVQSSGGFVVNVLSRFQQDVGLRFARKDGGKFHGLEIQRSDEGHPVIGGSHASFECQVITQIHSGTHIVFIAEVKGILLGPETTPLTYHSGRFGRFLEASSGDGAALTKDFSTCHQHDLW